MAYQANGVHFDGSNDYLSIVGDLTGNANSKLLSFSSWFRRGSTGTSQRVYRADGARLMLIWSTSNVLIISAQNSSGTTVLAVNTSAITDTNNWVHIMGSFDLSDTNKRHLYVNDVPDLSVSTYTNDTIDFARNDHGVGAADTGTVKYHGDMADLWIAPGQYIDLSDADERRKFIGPNGGAVDLGSNGEAPTATAPLMFFSGQTSTWHTNKGTGGGFTENGALTDAVSNPPTEPDVAFLERGIGRGLQRGIMRGI